MKPIIPYIKSKKNTTLLAQISPIKENFTTKPTSNLFNKSDVDFITGSFINTAGNIVSASGYGVSGFISADANTTYICKYNTGWLGTNAAYIYYDSNKNKLGYSTGTLSADKSTLTITTPNVGNIKYVRVNVIPTDKDIFMFVKGSVYPSVYEAYGEITTLATSIAFNDSQTTKIQNLSGKNPLDGKIIAYDGDSIAYGAGWAGAYAKIIAENNNVTYTNYAVNGATIVGGTVDPNTGQNRHWVSRNVANMRADANYIIFEGGINDFYNAVPIGTITAGFNDTYDDTTFCGALENTFRQAQLRWLNGKIGFIIVHKCVGAYDVINKNQSELYWDKVKQICEKWNIPCLDLYSESGLNIGLTTIKTTYTANGDGTHPNEAGYRTFIAPKIEAWMKTL